MENINTFMLKIQDDIFATESDLGKLQAVLEQLGDNSYFTSSNLNEHEQIYTLANHETSSRLYYVLIDYVDKCLQELESISNKIDMERNNVVQLGNNQVQ